MNEIKPLKEPIYITRPVLPSLESVYKKIQEIWASKWLTNMGTQHNNLQIKLRNYLNVPFLSLFCNGTLALELACKALELTGEVITTPFTFPATVNSLLRNNLKPVFADINLNDCNINIDSIIENITPMTSAIMPVHVFGNPCEVEEIQKIANEYDLKVIYDAAHCFGVKYKDKGIGLFGDISMFSFHATKIFHTIEGGALTYSEPELEEKLSLLKNFGIKNEEEVILPGTNAKLNEVQAAIGLLNLELIENEIKQRKKLTQVYNDNFSKVNGIRCITKNQNTKSNYQYFPIIIDEEIFKYSRNQIYEHLKKYNIFSRKYFYPLCTDYKYFKDKKYKNLNNAKKIANQVLCLPIYGELSYENAETIVKVIIQIK